MLEDGYEEPWQAIAWSRPTPEEYQSHPLWIVPADLGPSTRDEAIKYGLVGSMVPVDSGEGGYLVSQDAEFDQAAVSCAEAIDDAVPSLAQAQDDGLALADAVRSDFVSSVSDQLLSLTVQRYRCVQSAGYDALDPEAAARSDWDEVLASVDLEPGQFTTEPDQIPVAPGDVGAFPPPPQRQYEPTNEETALALAFVECGTDMAFLESVAELADRARARMAEKYGPESARIKETLVTVDREVETLRKEKSWDTPVSLAELGLA